MKLTFSLLSDYQPKVPELLDFESCDGVLDNDDSLADCSDGECTTIDPVSACGERCDNIDNDFNSAQDCEDDGCAGTPDFMCVWAGLVLSGGFPFILRTLRRWRLRR